MGKIKELLMYSTSIYRGEELLYEFEHLYPDTEMLDMIGVMESRHIPDVPDGEEIPGIRVYTINTDDNTVVFDNTFFHLRGSRNRDRS